ncbi:hypothetical protein OAH18_00760 [bacterium]|nr:hypothetical protein [bacterium]
MIISILALIIVAAILLGGLLLLAMLWKSGHRVFASVLMMGGCMCTLVLMYATVPRQSRYSPVPSRSTGMQPQPSAARYSAAAEMRIPGITNTPDINIDEHLEDATRQIEQQMAEAVRQVERTHQMTEHDSRVIVTRIDTGTSPTAEQPGNFPGQITRPQLTAAELEAIDTNPPATSFGKGFPDTVSWRMPIAIIAVLVVCAVFVIGSKSRTAIGATLGLVLLLLTTGMFLWRGATGPTSTTFAQFNSQSASASPYADRQYEVQQQLDQTTDQTIWTTAADDTHVATTYASLTQLGRGIASQVIDRLNAQNQQPDYFAVSVDTGSFSSDEDLTPAAEGCADRLADVFTEAGVKVNTSNGGGGHSKATRLLASVRLKIDKIVRRPAPWDASKQQDEYTIKATLSVAGDQRQFKASFVDKPWVDDMSKYLAERSQYFLLRARSNRLQESEAAVRHEAFASAANQIAPTLQQYMTIHHSHVGTIENKIHKQHLYNAIANHNVFVIDKFPQSVQAHGQQLWREAVLLNVDREGLSWVAKRMAEQHRQATNTKTSQIAGLIGLMLLIIATSVGLNSLTKGYYTNRIGLGLGAGLVLILLTILG